jgi:serine/threonine protein phosphatase PrpC
MAEVFQISSATLTHPGRKRANNEDYIAYFEPGEMVDLQASGRLYILADGVGGAFKGERASRYAAERVLYEYYHHPEVEPGQRLKEAMRLAGNEIFDYAERSGNYRRMATTMVAAAIRDNLLTVANVGDSRAYLIRNGRVRQLTVDHTTAGELMRNGLMSEEEALTSKSKNRLTRSLGGEADVIVDVFPEIALEPGDRVLLCSDGLSRYAFPEDIARILKEGPIDEAVEQAIDFANQQGGIDNISVALVAVEKAAEEVGREPRQPRGHVPVLRDWEVMETRPETAGRKRLTRRKWWEIYPPHLSRYALPMTAGLVLVFLVVTIGLFLANGREGLSTPTQMIISPTGTAALATSPVENIVIPAATQESYPAEGNSPEPEPSPTMAVPPIIPLDPSSMPASTEITITSEDAVSESDDQIRPDQWCVYVVDINNAKNLMTLKAIVEFFSQDGDQELLKLQVFEATGGKIWNTEGLWEVWDGPLEDKSEVALRFVHSTKGCKTKGGIIKPIPSTN